MTGRRTDLVARLAGAALGLLVGAGVSVWLLAAPFFNPNSADSTVWDLPAGLLVFDVLAGVAVAGAVGLTVVHALRVSRRQAAERRRARRGGS